MRLARIDIFTVVNYDIDYIEYIAGASRVSYEWPESLVSSVAASRKPQYIRLQTEDGPAVGLLYPVISEKSKATQFVVGVITFSRVNAEILSRAQRLLVISTIGLLVIILLVLAVSYRWLIGRPLGIIIRTIDEFQTGQYVKRIPITRRDEWGHLAEHFNSMAQEIEQVLARNQELTRNLEDRVQEATRRVVELQKQVNQLQQLTALGYLTATLAHDLGNAAPLHCRPRQSSPGEGDRPPDEARKLELIVQQTQRLNTVIQNVRRATRPPEPHFEAVRHPGTPERDALPRRSPHAESGNRAAGPSRRTDPADQRGPLPCPDRPVQPDPECHGGDAGRRAGSRSPLRADPDRREVSLTVQDTGNGIPPELMERICEPFFSTHQEEGLRGLGLAIVQDIVKIHGGRIAIESRSGRGDEDRPHLPGGGIGAGTMPLEYGSTRASFARP